MASVPAWTTLFVEWYILLHPTLNLPISTHLCGHLYSCRTSNSPVYLFLHRKATFSFLGTVNLLQHSCTGILFSDIIGLLLCDLRSSVQDGGSSRSLHYLYRLLLHVGTTTPL